MKKTITSFLALVAMMFAINANAVEFAGGVTVLPNSDYSQAFVSFDFTAVAEALETDTATLAAAIAADYALGKDGATMMANISNPEETVVAGTTNAAYGYWMTAEGYVTTWGNNSVWFTDFYWSTEDDYFGFGVGQFPNACKEGESYSATFRFTFNEKSADFKVTLSIASTPQALISTLQIVGEAEKMMDQFARATGKTDADTLLVADIAEKLGVAADEVANLPIMVMNLYEDAKTDTITAKGNGSWTLASIFDEDTGDDLAECGLSGTNPKLLISGLTYDAEVGGFVYGVGQYSNAKCKVGEKHFAYVYVVNDTKAYKLKLGYNIIEKPETELQRVGQTDITVKAEVDNNYGTTKFTFSFDEILEALGCSLDDLDDVYAWAGENDMSDNHTEGGMVARTSGYYLNDDGYIASWGDASAMFINFSDGIFTSPTYQIGQMSGHFSDITEPVERTAELLFEYMGKYWALHITYIVRPEGWKEEGEEDEPEPEWECVKTLYVSHQHLAGGADYNTDFEDFDFSVVSEALGTDSYGIWTYKGKSDGTLVYDQNQTMGHCSGFWMGTNTYDDGTGRMVVDNAGWGTNSFGICFLVNSGCNSSGLGHANQLEFWARSNRQAGDEYNADIFFMDEATSKYVQLIVTVKYVTEKEAQATQVGAESITLPARGEADPESGVYTEVDLTAMYEALGCTAEEFAEGGKWLALNGNGQFSDENCDELEGFFFLGNGTTTAEGDELIHAGYCYDEEKFFSWIIDDANLENKYQVEIRALYGDKFYTFTVNVGAIDTAINGVTVKAAQSGNIYDLSGRIVKNPTKGLYIQNGKKVAL